MKSTLTRAAAIAAAAALSTAALTACNVSSSDGLSSGSDSGSMGSAGSSNDHGKTPAPKDDDVRGCEANEENHEVPVKEGIDLGPLTLNVLYFQPGQMMQPSMMLPYDKSAAHLEVDTKITADGTKWGYSKDETPANMDMKYAIINAAGETVNEGHLMEMNAGDGSHYGTNVPEGVMTDGQYTLRLTVGHPMHYALHKDLVTGVEANDWWETKTVDVPWTYKTPEKSKNPVRDCDVPAYQPTVKVVETKDPNKKPVLNPESQWMTPGEGKCSEVEINIGQAFAAPMKFDINYFQPGGMMEQWLTGDSMMPKYQDSVAHLEADIKMYNPEGDQPVGAKGTDYGYSVDETPANLNVKYTIVKPDGSELASGKFMEMNADDGSHYGTNLRKDINLEPGTDYTLKLMVSHPTDYSLHIDNKTGVAVRHWYKDFTVSIPWHYTGNQTPCIVSPWWNAFPQPVPAIEKDPALKNEGTEASTTSES